MSMTLVEEVELLAPASSIAVASIPDTGKDLYIMADVRSLVVATHDTLQLRFNGDSGANYSHIHRYEGSSGGKYRQDDQTQFDLLWMPGVSVDANAFGRLHATVPSYASIDHWQQIEAETGLYGGSVETRMVAHTFGLWHNVANAIDEVGLFTLSGSGFAIGSRLAVYKLG